MPALVYSQPAFSLFENILCTFWIDISQRLAHRYWNLIALSRLAAGCGARAIILSVLLDVFLRVASRFVRLACNSDALWACGIPCSLAQVSTQNLGRLLISFDLPLHRYFGEMWSCALGATGFGSAEVLNGKVNFVLLQRRGLTLLFIQTFFYK